MTREDFERWLDVFGRAWETNDPQDVGALVPESCEWHSGPFSEVFRDRQTLVDHWISTVNSQDDIKTSYEILSVEDGRGICRYRASHLQHKTALVTEDMILIVRLDDQARCVEFQEWPVSSRQPLEAFS
jgi:hypothetical protein